MSDKGQSAPLVSVFTLTFNQELYIGECIESVQAQDYGHWEMMIVDDGSTDDTWNIVQGYASRDGRIRAYRRDNKGLLAMAEAYNLMLRESSGALVAILDGDDLWPPYKLSTQTVYHYNQGFDFTFGICGSVQAGERTSDVFPSVNDRDRIVLIENMGIFAEEYLRGSFPISAVTCMINRSCLLKIGGFIQPDYLLTTDYPTWVTAFSRGCKPHFVDAELGFWRIQVGQTTWKRAREMALGTLRYSQEFAGNVNEQTVMSAGRRNFISDSLYRHAIYSLNQKDYAGVKTALSELIKYKGYRSIARFAAALGVRLLRGRSAVTFKLR